MEDMEVCGSKSFHELRQYVEVQVGFETFFDDSIVTQNKVLLQTSDDNTDHSLQMWEMDTAHSLPYWMKL